MREVIIIDQKKGFEGCSWFKFSDLGIALSIALKFDASVVKVSKPKFRTFLALIPLFIKVTEKKLVGEPFCLSPSLSRVKLTTTSSSAKNRVYSFCGI